ncbi:MAG: DUF4190 domain-containing protein [Planctomycetes bacterium]|nr:DUF4190 domain-containing protein [Planctomycetota bacterium]
MSAGTYLEPDIAADDDYVPYRPLSRAAVASLIIAILSFSALAASLLVVLPLIGLVLGIIGFRTVRRYPDEFTGRGMAIAGIIVNSVLLLGGTALHAAIYATEVPDGCVRISFADLQPNRQRPDLPVSPEAVELDGKRVFIKGYVYPDGQQYNIKRFVLVPDMGTCCFGGQPKLTDMIEVTLRDPYRVVFERRKRKLAGVLRVDTSLKPVSGLGGVYYQLDADYVR